MLAGFCLLFTGTVGIVGGFVPMMITAIPLVPLLVAAAVVVAETIVKK